MDLKKILALAMIALVALPSLTMAVADYDGGAGPAGAIERARIYLNKVMTSVEKTASLYPNDEIMQEYLNELYALLGWYEYEGPEFLLQSENGISERSDFEPYGGNYSVHLETIGALPKAPDWLASEARIVIPMPEGFTLGELETLSWWEYLITGYPPHVDVYLNFTGDSDPDDVLVFEYAYNDMNHYAEGQITGDTAYGAEKNAWYATFSDDGNGTAKITNSSVAWLNSGSPGPDAWVNHTLAEWKDGITVDAGTIDADSIVTRLEIEVDNWIVQTEAYVDDIKIDGVTYDFEEREEEDGEAKYYLDQASASLGEGDIRSAARSLASARNILGRVNGLLKSMAKAHKVTRTEKFNRRIQGIKDKIERPKGPKK